MDSNSFVGGGSWVLLMNSISNGKWITAAVAAALFGASLYIGLRSTP